MGGVRLTVSSQPLLKSHQNPLGLTRQARRSPDARCALIRATKTGPCRWPTPRRPADIIAPFGNFG